MTADRSSTLATMAQEPSILRLLPSDWVRIARGARVQFALGLALAVVTGVQLSALRNYFYADDFLPFSDLRLAGTWGYVRDLFLLRDVTPNWRFLTGIFYLAEYRAFGLNPAPFLVTALTLHACTAALIFHLVRRAMSRVWPAFVASVLFGITPSYAVAVGHITALTHVLAGALFMVAAVVLYEGLERRQTAGAVVAASVAFAGAIAANESTGALAPVLALIAMWKWPMASGWWRERREWMRVAVAAAPFMVLGGAAIVTFTSCRCTGSERISGVGGHMFGNAWIYLGRLLYPVGMEAPGEPGAAHIVAGVIVAAVGTAYLVRGPAFARITVVLLALSVAPYLLLNWILATRYVYPAAIPFSMLCAIVMADVTRYASRRWRAAPTAIAVAIAVVAGVYGWRTWQANEAFADRSAVWREMAARLPERYPDVPEGSLVIVRGGPLTNVFWVAPVRSLGQVLWGDVLLRVAPEDAHAFCTREAGGTYVLDYDGGRFTPVFSSERPVAGTPGGPPVTIVSCPMGQDPPWLAP